MRPLSNEQHDAVYQACIELLERSGARAALLCDAATGELLASFGDVGAQGEVDEVERVSEHETIVRGGAGELYGVDVRGGLLLAVLHDGTALEQLRVAAAEAAGIIGELIPPALPEEDEHAGHDHAAPETMGAPAEGAAAKPAPKKAKAAAAKRRAKKSAAPKRSTTMKKSAAAKPSASAKKAAVRRPARAGKAAVARRPVPPKKPGLARTRPKVAAQKAGGGVKKAAGKLESKRAPKKAATRQKKATGKLKGR